MFSGMKIVLLFLTFWSSTCFAIDYPAKPITGFIVDDAKIISAQASTQVNTILTQLYNDKKVTVYVVTIPSFAMEKAPDISIENYTYDLAEKWGMMGANDNYSVMFLISRDDKFARIQLGNSWRISYAVKAQEILDNAVVPQFRAGDFSGGIVQGIQEIVNLVRATVINTQPRVVTIDSKPVLIFGVIVIALILIGTLCTLTRATPKYVEKNKTRAPRKRKK